MSSPSRPGLVKALVCQVACSIPWGRVGQGKEPGYHQIDLEEGWHPTLTCVGLGKALDLSELPLSHLAPAALGAGRVTGDKAGPAPLHHVGRSKVAGVVADAL